MKIQDIFSVTVSFAADLAASSFGGNPVLRGFAVGFAQSLQAKGWKWASELPQAKEMLRKAETLNLYSQKTGEADGAALLAFLDGYVGSGSSFKVPLPFGFGSIEVPCEDLRIWVGNLRKLGKGGGNGRRTAEQS